MKILIQNPGVFNDDKNKAHSLNAGDELETREWYAQSLISSGFATPSGTELSKQKTEPAEAVIPSGEEPIVLSEEIKPESTEPEMPHRGRKAKE